MSYLLDFHGRESLANRGALGPALVSDIVLTLVLALLYRLALADQLHFRVGVLQTFPATADLLSYHLLVPSAAPESSVRYSRRIPEAVKGSGSNSYFTLARRAAVFSFCITDRSSCPCFRSKAAKWY